MMSSASGKTSSGKLYKRIFLLIILALIVIAAIVAQILLRPDRKASLMILYTGGIQGHYQYEEGVSAGYGKIMAVADRYREEGYEVVLIDSGSSLGGSSGAELSGGSGMLSMMNAAGYNAMTPGSLDFIYGMDQLKNLRSQANFPFLACNLKNADGSNAFEDYKVMNVNGVRIGITGVTDGLSQQLTVKEGLTYEDPIASVQEAVSSMGGRVDAFVVIASIDDKEIIEQLAAIKDVDLVITASKAEQYEQEISGGAMIVSPVTNALSIGAVTLDIQRNNGSVTNTWITEAEYAGLPDDAAAQEAIASVQKEQQVLAEDARVLSEEYIEKKRDAEEEDSPETAVGFLTADAMLWEGSAYAADAALIRSEEIKGTLSGGRLKVSDVLALYDDDLHMVICRMTGGELRDIIEKSLESYPDDASSFIQVSGIRCELDPGKSMGSRISDIIVGSSSLDDAGTYYVAMTNRMAEEYGFGLHSGGFEAACRSIASIVCDYMSGDQGIVNSIVPETSGEDDSPEDDESDSGSIFSARIHIL